MASLNKKFKKSIKNFQESNVDIFHPIDDYVADVKFLSGQEDLSDEQLTATYNFYDNNVSSFEAANQINGI